MYSNRKSSLQDLIYEVNFCVMLGSYHFLLGGGLSVCGGGRIFLGVQRDDQFFQWAKGQGRGQRG